MQMPEEIKMVNNKLLTVFPTQVCPTQHTLLGETSQILSKSLLVYILPVA